MGRCAFVHSAFPTQCLKIADTERKESETCRSASHSMVGSRTDRTYFVWSGRDSSSWTLRLNFILSILLLTCIIIWWSDIFNKSFLYYLLSKFLSSGALLTRTHLVLFAKGCRLLRGVRLGDWLPTTLLLDQVLIPGVGYDLRDRYLAIRLQDAPLCESLCLLIPNEHHLCPGVWKTAQKADE